MDIPKNFDPVKAEKKWYQHWMDKNYFHSEPNDKESYTVVIPPPNVTGVLHMGHMLNNTIQDVLVRRARMLGKNACWVPGTDHASIATEAKVVNKLRQEGIKKSDLSRKHFLAHAMDWKDKHGGIILDQLKKLGASCDWERTNFTMDGHYYKSVIHIFNDLFEKGLVYRGLRMINWDPEAKTALSDEEVIYKEVNSKLYHIRYKIAGSEDDWLTIATTRPETILGDTAICINPDDGRYLHLHGKKAVVPVSNREVPIITDDYVDMEFGTGCLKVTPAHDINDYDLGQKHNLETIDIFHSDGKMNDKGLHYEGKDRFEVRKHIADELQDKGYLVKVEDHINKVGFSERTDVAIEPRLSKQWFLSMEKMAEPALENVMNGNIKFHPEKFKNTYRHWMENIKDWCISRQLWWGHQIPAWYLDEEGEEFVVAETEEQAVKRAQEKTGNPKLTAEDLRRDEDVLDTWFSSWLWPMAVFDGINHPDNEEVNYYYPTNDLVTAPEIMFFWVARMIMAGYEYRDELPFKNVYYTGIVRDKLGRKMSKSLGNSPDPIELIEKYGADGVRLGILISSPAGNDLPFDIAQCEQGRNFSNKIWNAFRLIKSWESKDIKQPEASIIAQKWFEQKMNVAIDEVNDHFKKFRISDALMTVYKLVWDDYCSWYLEMIKPAYQQPIDKLSLEKAQEFMEQLLKLMHPFTPFITEELWHLIRDRDEDIIVSQWPESGLSDESYLKDFEFVQDIIGGVRNLRKQNNIANKIQLELMVKNSESFNQAYDPVILKMGNLSSLEYINEKVPQSFSFMVKSNEYFIPFGDQIDTEAEKQKLEEELEYTKGFLQSVRKKLSNENFVKGAPEKVVQNERSKENDALNKIKVLEEKIDLLN